MATELPPVLEKEELVAANHVCHISAEGIARKSCAELIERTVEELEGISQVKVAAMPVYCIQHSYTVISIVCRYYYTLQYWVGWKVLCINTLHAVTFRDSSVAILNG